MKKIIIVLSLLILSLIAYSANGSDSLLALKGKDAFEYIKLYRKNIEVHNCTKEQNPQKIPNRCQKYYSTMISDINKKFGINGLTTNDIESEKANKYIAQEANKYVKINLQKIMTKNS